jgi:hypothetical protein
VTYYFEGSINYKCLKTVLRKMFAAKKDEVLSVRMEMSMRK